MKFSKLLQIIFITLLSISIASCVKFEKVDQRKMPDGAKAKARKNIEEGRGASIGGLLGRGKTTYEFSTSNPMWRASLETLDFLPLTTVDYSGGVIISDWYTNSNSSSSNQESIKISIRFLSNDIRTESLKVIVHKKTCNSNNQNCKITQLTNTKIKEELHATIIRKAALLEKESKEKKN